MTRVLAALGLAVAAAPAFAGPFPIAVTGGKDDLSDVVCTVPVPPGDPVNVTALKGPDGKLIPAATLTANPGSAAKQEIVFVLPKLKAGETVALTMADAPAGSAGFVADKADLALKYRVGAEAVPVLQLVKPDKYVPTDAAKKQTDQQNPTTKPFHHLFDATGKVRLTNGPEGKFPHHRGLFFGFNKVSYDDKSADVWHGIGGAHQFCTGVTAADAGPAAGRQQIAVDWIGKDGKPFAHEDRAVTAFRLGDATLVEIASLVALAPGGPGKVHLDGDPQHAGFHFRANVEVEKTDKETYFLRPDGKGEPGKERNWDSKTKDPKAVNLPWLAMSFVAGGKRYTAVYLDHPDNPKEARFSERTYGRFGSYFEYDITADKPLKVRYRVWVQPGEVTPEQCENLSRGFVSPPKPKA